MIVVHEPGDVRAATVGEPAEKAAQTLEQTLAAFNGFSRTLRHALGPAPAGTVTIEVGPLLGAGGRAFRLGRLAGDDDGHNDCRPLGKA